MATPSNILAWRIPWTEDPCGRKESVTTEATDTLLLLTSVMEQDVTSDMMFSMTFI